MTGTFRLSSAVGGNLSPYQAAILPGLPASARLLITILDRRSKGHPECWCGNATLAGLLKCCERSIRNALTALEGAGLIRVVRDYALKSRRRILLLWKRPCDPSVPANVAVQVAANPCPEVGPPPDPPIVEPEGNTPGESGGECEAEAGPPPPPGIVEASAPEEAQSPLKATPEQVAELVEQAAKVFPSQPKQWVLALAKAWTLSWVRAAIGRAGAKRAEGAEVRTGYVVRTLQGFAAEGGPPAELMAPEQTEEESLREFAEILARTPDVTW